MTTTERTDLADAVMSSRDEVAPGFDSALLEAIVGAEAAAAGDADVAMRAIDAAVTAALGRGVGRADERETVAEVSNEDRDYLEDEG